jgi:beta-galactosidase
MSLAGGVGAVWIKTREGAGTIRLDATHPALGTKSVEIRVRQQPIEEVVI